MSTRNAPPRLTPDQMLVYYLDEIAGRLADQAAQGLLTSQQIEVETNWVPIIVGWKSLEVKNKLKNADDSDCDDVYIRLNDIASPLPWENGEAPLSANESLRMDLKAKKHGSEGGAPVLYFICSTGKATIKLWQLL